MGNAGSPYALFRRALATGNLHLIRTAAAEMPGPLPLRDALEVLALIARDDPDRYRRAAARWAGRAALEQPDVELDELAILVAALDGPSDDLLERVDRALRHDRLGDRFR